MFRWCFVRMISLFSVLFVAMGALTADAKNVNSLTGMAGSAYYKTHPMFHPFPDEKAGLQSIDRFGPVGIGIELLQPAFKMRVKNVEEGSPAAATGKLKAGQLIDSINGRIMADIDPRQILGDIIAKAEASDGLVKLIIRENKDAKSEAVVIKIPALGTYSKTWPLNCKKSDRIVREMAEYLKQSGSNGMGMGHLFLLSTGDKSDLEYVGTQMQKVVKDNAGKEAAGGYPWYIGYGGLSLCEYYLRTGDKAILHTIKAYAEQARRTIYNGSWGQKGGANYNYMAGGHMNAAGVHCVTFLLLAKECGVEVDEFTLKTSLRHFYRYAGRGAVSYGDGFPEITYTDNGKNGGLAFAMAAAASLTPEGEASIYAKARDAAAVTSFYSTSWMLHGHTGGGIGEIWRGPAMGLLYKKAPSRYREFMNNRAWFLDISRRFDGSFGIVGGERYDTPDSWAIGMALNYTVPRKHLRIYGAPRTKFCASHQLPKRPWGTAADEQYYSFEAASIRGAKPQDVESERLVDDSSWPVLRRLRTKDVSDEMLLKYTHHPDFILARDYAAGTVRSLGRADITLELLRSKDPRVRHVGVASIDKKNLSDEMVELLLAMVNDPEESWYATMEAMKVLGSARAELVAPHVDRLVYWLNHEDWWISSSAMTALTKVAADKRYYKKILPIIGGMVANNTRAVALAPLNGIVSELHNADPEVQAYAVKTLGKAYADFPEKITVPGGQNMNVAESFLLRGQAWNLSKIPGGFDELYRVSRERFAADALPHKELYMDADASKFGPKVKEALKPVVLDYLIPQYMGEGNHVASNKSYLMDEANSTKPYKWNYYYREPRMEQMIRFYNRIDIHDYDWHLFGPDLNEIKWEYHTFDPPEKKIWAPGARYRKVTYPKGMEKWYTVDFDSKAAGWKSGLAPFGQVDGKKMRDGSVCRFPFCRHDVPVETLWDKEVLIMRTKLKLPPFKDGHRYRLLVGGMSNVNRGEGYRIYVNGKQMMERDRGIGRREGGQPLTYYIDKGWWPDFEEEVTISATSFLQFNFRTSKTQQHFSIFLQEAKNPPLPEEAFTRGKSMKPMRSTAWQETKEDSDMFRYDGKFVANKAIVGNWALIGEVAELAAFDPAKKLAPVQNSPLQQLTFSDNGKTDKDSYSWSGNFLMDLKDFQALKMTPRTIGGSDYLFIEAGGYSKKDRNGWKPEHASDWKPALYVLKLL